MLSYIFLQSGALCENKMERTTQHKPTQHKTNSHIQHVATKIRLNYTSFIIARHQSAALPTWGSRGSRRTGWACSTWASLWTRKSWISFRISNRSWRRRISRRACVEIIHKMMTLLALIFSLRVAQVAVHPPGAPSPPGSPGSPLGPGSPGSPFGPDKDERNEDSCFYMKSTEKAWRPVL